MLKSARVGLAWLGSHMGDVSSLPGSVTVRFADGEETIGQVVREVDHLKSAQTRLHSDTM